MLKQSARLSGLLGLFGLSGLFGLFGLSGLFGSSGSSRLFGLSGFSSKILDETRDGSARFVACLHIPSRRSLLQHDEDANSKVSTQHSQAVRHKI
jgi:hypothetical protein